MTSTEQASGQQGSTTRVGHMLLAVTIGIALVGFLIGIRDEPAQQSRSGEAQPAEDTPHATDGQPVTAADYANMAGVKRGPNASWLKALPAYVDTPTDFYGSHPPTAQQRAQALAVRSEGRAFSGAPPVVPHAIDERNAQACMACHGTGLKVGDIVAPRMSHHYLANCTQCHVEAVQSFAASTTATANIPSNFVGLAEPGAGERIGPGAPPTIPHALWMRSECSACHGSLGRDGLRSSHPWRSNCTQCHAPSRGFDWAPLEEPPRREPKQEPAPGALAVDLAK